jgi:hypothetical protein
MVTSTSKITIATLSLGAKRLLGNSTVPIGNIPELGSAILRYHSLSSVIPVKPDCFLT